jgi:tRNA G18 (ribose-2'-O)-methylase SpoU
MSLLTAFPILNEDDFRIRMPKLWKAIANELVPSTRRYIEWFMILGLLKHGGEVEVGKLMGRLLEFNLPTGAAMSLLTIVLHVGMKIEGDIRLIFFKTVFHRILPFFMHNNYSVRQMSLFVFDRLFSRYQVDNVIDDALPEGYENMAAFIRNSESCQRFLTKLQQDWFLTFDPIADYTIHTIYDRLPRENDIAWNECISVYSFINVNPRTGNIPFGEEKAMTTNLDELRIDNASPSTVEGEAILKDYQQKTNPWDMDLIDQDLFELRRRREIERRKAEFDIVIVASLVDRIPNLAGLTRTCEVFGAASLVLPSLSIVDDINFRNISMTSEKWLNLIEIPPIGLGEYLQHMRMNDYRIIAIEQSSQSHSLLHYIFPRKCCLVLGGEKEGVPAEILHLVDDCVEIPQYGMIRSLNVHVSGSLVLWEARRQRALNKE